MADNLFITTGSSATTSGTVATDQLVTGEHVQFMKLMDGLLDSTTAWRIKTTAPLVTDAGAVVRPLLYDANGIAITTVSASVSGTEAALATRNYPGSTNQYTSLTSPNALASGIFATITGYGSLRVSPEATAVFSDVFDGAVDTTNKWATAQGTVPPSVTTGVLNMATNASTANATTILKTLPTFAPQGLTFLGLGFTIKLPITTYTTGQHLFWGVGSPNADTAASPLTDAIGFEVDITGALNAVVYAAGTKISTSTLVKKTDGAYHKYAIAYRTDTIIFYLDSTEVPVASFSYTPPAIQTLPIRFHSLNGATITGTPVFSVQAVGGIDTGRNASQISDGVFPWRKASIDAAGNQLVALTSGSAATFIGTVSASVSGISNPLPVGTNKIGTIDIATAPAVAKGTQGANALPVQDLKDSGRTGKIFILDSFAIAATTETLMTLSGSYANGLPITSTAFSASVGKTLRVQAITANIHTITGNTTAVNVLVRIRASGSTATVSSPVQNILALQGVAAANSSGIPQLVEIPDGWEFPNPSSFSITTTCAGFVTTTAAPKIDITIVGYEY